MMRGISRVALLALATLAAGGCREGNHPEAQRGVSPPVAAAAPVAPAVGRGAAADRQAFFGELHLHTSWSFDAYGFTEARTNPDIAYRFARGEAVDYLGLSLRRREPLDFMAVTDHAEFIGFLSQLDDSQSALSRSSFGKEYREARAQAGQAGLGAFFQKVQSTLRGNAAMVAQLQGAEIAASTWQRTIDMANANYRPGRFTTFVAYEWTSHPGQRHNLHRNVIFRGADAPPPFTADQSLDPEDLWSYLEANRAKGVEALAIPHNANASDGNMFAMNDSAGRPIDAAYAHRRAVNEPLNEIYQTKGESETHPALSPADEFAGFELMDRLVPRLDLPGTPPGSYLRDALGRGLVIERRTGVNPFKYGAVAATDIHNGLSNSAEDAIERAFGFDPTVNAPDRAQAQFLLAEPPQMNPPPPIMGSGGLTGVWAEANTREALFDAMRRRETFGTSGTRLQVRLFGGWQFPADLLRRSDWVAAAYQSGTPMGSDLPSAPAGSRRAPSFVVWALKDPGGANLDRIQIVKVWLDRGGSREQVFDVALSGGRTVDPASGKAPPVGNTVDLAAATYRNSIGAAELSVVWTDPGFDPAQSAVYYARVLEIPTPRWTTILAARHHLPVPKDSPATLQERGWSSPIWYRPT